MTLFLRKKCFAWRNFLTGVREIARIERQPGIPLSPALRLRAMRAGFTSASWAMYGFGERPDERYLPDYPQLLYLRRVNRDQQVFQNKLLFRATYGGLLDIPRNVCMIDQGKVLPLPADSEPPPARPGLGWLLDRCRALGGMVWKPIEGLGGRAVHLIRHDGAHGFSINGEPASVEALHALARSRADFLVCEAVRQGRYAEAIFPGSVNTVRFWTMIDPASGKAFLAAAVHRFGTRASVPVDNWAAGGLVAPIDLATGELGEAAPKPAMERPRWLARHPDSGAAIAGARIPNWERIVARLLAVTEAYRGISHCGWDVVVREDGFSVLEGNNVPTLTMLQLRGGLLGDERVRRFLRHHELVA